jgi:hypothetical protein
MTERPGRILLSQPYSTELGSESGILPNARRFYTESVGFGRLEVDIEQPAVRIVFSDVSPYLTWMMDYGKFGECGIDDPVCTDEYWRQGARRSVQEALNGNTERGMKNLKFFIEKACFDINRPAHPF